MSKFIVRTVYYSCRLIWCYSVNLLCKCILVVSFTIILLSKFNKLFYQLMDLINTTISTTENQCLQLQLSYKFSCTFQIIIAIIVAVFVPLDVIFVIIPFIVLVVITIRKWRNPAKIYYFSIITSNIVAFIFVDIPTTFLTISGIIYGYLSIPIFLNIVNIFAYLRSLLLSYNNDIFCRIFNLLADLGPLCVYWTTGIFAVHRMLVVLHPLHVHKLKMVFNKRTLIIILTIVSFLYIPDFWLFHQYIIASGKSYCIGDTGTLSFLSEYYSQLNYIKYIIPCILTSISIAVICTTIIKAKNQRLKLNSQNRRNNLELRSTVILIILGVSYGVFSIPYSILYVLDQIFTLVIPCNSPIYLIYMMIQPMEGSFQNLQIITRVVDAVIIFIMVPEFGQVFNDLLSWVANSQNIIISK